MAEAQFWIGVHGVISHAKKILILKRAPSMVYMPGCWDLPGGHLAVGETFEQCLAREIAEETSLGIAPGRLLGLNQAIEGPYVQIFFACAAEVQGPIKLQPWEHDDARWLSFDELSLIDRPIPYLERIVSRGMLDYLR
ncbi:MAG TPA: NUDIX domain-containing protein [Candidatus Binataceae bacterium]|nr:NUDIX domain-containing protein [Candidatus Binataceae bacterium]